MSAKFDGSKVGLSIFESVSIEVADFLELSIQQKGVCHCCQQTPLPAFHQGLVAHKYQDQIWLICDDCLAILARVDQEPQRFRRAVRFHQNHLVEKPAPTPVEEPNPALPKHLGF